MAVLIKRSEAPVGMECPWRCCTEVYGKNVKKIRRAIKRREARAWRRDQENN